MPMNKDFITFDVLEESGLGEVASVRLPDPTLLDYYTRRNDRCILWNDDIEDGFVEIYQDILRWNKEDIDSGVKPEDAKPIKIYINSDGGSVSAVFTIIDLLLMSYTPVITIGLGKCYSSGGLLLMAGHKRLLLPNCTVLIHDGQSGSYGAIGKMLDNLEFTKELEVKIKSYILSRTSITEDDYDKNYRRDWWIFANDAVDKYHIADKIVTNIKEIL